MHPLVNHLIQLQELILIRDEQKISGGRHHLEQLDGNIKTMTRKLDRTVREHFEKLVKKDHVTVVPVHNNLCAGCGMALAISHVQAVRLGRDVLTCPNCARMLYVPQGEPRRIARRTARFGPRKVGITRFSDETLMLPRLASTDLEGCIRELAAAMAEGGFVDNGDKLAEAALRREGILPTAVGHGLAFPHARGVEGGGLALALGLSPRGLQPVDGGRARTRIVFFTAIPTAAAAFYLKLLSGLTEAFMSAERRKELLACRDGKALWKTLVKSTRATVK